MSKKIYISLKETESLIFNKCLTVPKNRLEIQRAQAELSVNIYVKKENLLEKDENYIVLFSAVEKFEIPEKEEHLFLNYYRVPSGMIGTEDRMVRDSAQEEYTLPLEYETNKVEPNAKYLNLRNGLVGMVYYNYEMEVFGVNSTAVEGIIYSFSDLTPFKKLFISSLLDEGTFPLLRVKLDRFVIDAFYRLTWWGKFIADNYIKSIKFESNERLEEVKNWLRYFLNDLSIDSLNKHLLLIPSELKEEANFFIGYYLAAKNYEIYISDRLTFIEQFKVIEYEEKQELFHWVSFFISFFNSDVTQLYFIESIRNTIFRIEKLAYKLIENNFELKEEAPEIVLKNLDKKQLVTELIQLQNSRVSKEIQLISFSEAKDVFHNILYESSLKTNGFELNSKHKSYNLKNYCFYSAHEGFYLQLNIPNGKQRKDFIYYINKDSLTEEHLKELRIRRRPLERIFDKKKVLVGFITNRHSNLLDFYSSELQDAIQRDIEKIVLVFLVDMPVEKTHTLEFGNSIRTYKDNYEKLFGLEVELIVKNKQTKTDVEIKRNLRNLLEEYRISQIHVIDENFNNRKATWLLASNTEYFINEEGANYYGYYNLN